MKVTFLGTGTSQGVPVIGCDCQVCRSIDFKDKRLRSSIHFENEMTSIIVDIGPDFRQQVLRAKIQRVDAVLLTHEHKDHTAGLDDIRSFNFKQNIDIPLYGRQEVLDQVEKEFSYIFSENKYPGVPSVDLKVLDGSKFRINDQDILPVNVLHYKLPVYGFRFGDFAYLTDVKTIPSSEMSKLDGLEVLVLNALQNKPHLSHLTLSEAIDLAQKIGAKKTFFTHVSHNLGLTRDVDPTLPDGMQLAYDGLQIEL